VQTRMLPACTDSSLRPHGTGGKGGEGRRGEGREGRRECVRVDASVLPPSNFITDATVRLSHKRPSGHCPTIRPSVLYCPRDNLVLNAWGTKKFHRSSNSKSPNI
jgi:hypothetical protein